MSERGSFITEYIYCEKCFESLKTLFFSKGRHKFWCPQAVNGYDRDSRKDLPIIAGAVGGSFAGEEYLVFEIELAEEIQNVICHDVKIAVIADSGDPPVRLFEFKPCAYRIGWQDHGKRMLDECPYDEDSAENEQWTQGWLDADDNWRSHEYDPE